MKKEDNKEINEKQTKQQTKKQIKKKKRKIKILLVIIIILGILAGMFIARMCENGWNLQGFLATIMGHNKETYKNLEKIYVLVLGESGDTSYKLTDTIMVGAYDPKSQELSILSIPRDTYVGTNKEKASGSYKINAIYENGKSPEKTVEAVNKITGLDIKYYALIDTDSVIKLVDIIGGVNFYVPMDMKYDDYTQDLHVNLKEGMQLIDGNKAEQLLRFRHNNNGSTYPYEYGQEDYGRMRTQREFTIAALKQTVQAKNITKLKKLADLVFENIKTNIELSFIKDYIPYITAINTENIKTEQLPGVSEQKNGVWIYSYNKEKTTDIVQKLFLGQPLTENETTEE